MTDTPHEGQATKSERDAQLSKKGLAVIAGAADLEALQTRLIEARLEGTEAYEAFLYVIMPTPENRLPKPVVGPTLDFKKLIVQMLNASGKTKLTMLKEQPPIIEDVLLDAQTGRRIVRAMVCVIDEITGVVKWAVKEEVRRSPHAATTAVEKAEGKAYESHPSFNRKLVTAQIKKWLTRAGLDPKGFTIGGSTGPWADFFQRAGKAGVKPDEVRSAVRAATGGPGLSEIQTADQMTAAATAVAVAAQAPAEAAPGPPAAAPPAEGQGAVRARRLSEGRGRRDATPAPTTGTPAPAAGEASPPVEAAVAAAERIDAVEITRLRNDTLEIFGTKQLSAEIIRSLWHELGPADGQPGLILHYKRMHRVAKLIHDGAPLDTAIQMAKTLYPEAKSDAHTDPTPTF